MSVLRRTRWTLALALVLSAFVVVAHRDARAAGREVELIVAGSNDDAERLNRTVAEALANVGVQTHLRRIDIIDPHDVSRATSHDTAIAARLWLDCLAPGHVTLYLTTADASRIYARNFAMDRGLDAVALELLLLVTHDSVAALLAGGEVGVPREEFERTLPRPPPTPPAPKLAKRPQGASTWHFDAQYELEMLGPTTSEEGFAAQFDWEGNWVCLGMVGQVRLPLDVGSGPLLARLTSRAGRLFAAYPLRLSNATSVFLAAAFGLDWIDVQPHGTQNRTQPQPAFSVVDPIVRFLSSIRYRVWRVDVGVAAGMEVGLVNARYLVLSSGTSETVFSPWRLRPFGSVSLGLRR